MYNPQYLNGPSRLEQTKLQVHFADLHTPNNSVPGTSPMSFDWNDIPILLELAKTGNMSAAGRNLNIDPSTISRRLAAAEKALQVRLFIRDNSGYHPTETGLVFLGYAEKASGEVRSMLVDTRNEAEGVSGPVRLTAIDFFFSHWLVHRMSALLEMHPLLQLQLQPSNQSLSFTRREADFALRLARPLEDAGLVARKVGELGFAVYGADRFEAVTRDQWPMQPWLAYGEELADLPEMIWLREFVPPERQVVQVSSVSTLVHACEAGLGLSLLPCLLAEKKGLKRLSATPELTRSVWLLSHRAIGNISRYGAVASWLTQVFEADAGHLLGTGKNNDS
jgi:DNA-binding transcriptional LysR family regulator